MNYITSKAAQVSAFFNKASQDDTTTVNLINVENDNTDKIGVDKEVSTSNKKKTIFQRMFCGFSVAALATTAIGVPIYLSANSNSSTKDITNPNTNLSVSPCETPLANRLSQCHELTANFLYENTLQNRVQDLLFNQTLAIKEGMTHSISQEKLDFYKNSQIYLLSQLKDSTDVILKRMQNDYTENKELNIIDNQFYDLTYKYHKELDSIIQLLDNLNLDNIDKHTGSYLSYEESLHSTVNHTQLSVEEGYNNNERNIFFKNYSYCLSLFIKERKKMLIVGIVDIANKIHATRNEFHDNMYSHLKDGIDSILKNITKTGELNADIRKDIEHAIKPHLYFNLTQKKLLNREAYSVLFTNEMFLETLSSRDLYRSIIDISNIKNYFDAYNMELTRIINVEKNLEKEIFELCNRARTSFETEVSVLEKYSEINYTDKNIKSISSEIINIITQFLDDKDIISKSSIINKKINSVLDKAYLRFLYWPKEKEGQKTFRNYVTPQYSKAYKLKKHLSDITKSISCIIWHGSAHKSVSCKIKIYLM